jgi:hypothetical protein
MNIRARLAAYRAQQREDAETLEIVAACAAREVAWRHRLDSVSTEVLLQPIYSMARQSVTR